MLVTACLFILLGLLLSSHILYYCECRSLCVGAHFNFVEAEFNTLAASAAVCGLWGSGLTPPLYPVC